ncbi:16S rRNA (cytosine(1402)-N(4))-methyltransferase RsmH [Propionicimonas sp.]|uniref:16S rRNA (cytosine(1402)-N(4))-methyltransferase RsmH n=1 Tax=Propionicimonas sp. TaxID=1955623 RepID=UPI0017DE4186|nr:16S rRNA (cytosine(1402)-N(4))-methyltransferase RsmH [Propionicimonas sp.]MBU3977650.1 16S rRNA (cytosine(1402)-N(4))-methyltransferase RsmH [Actinomycetota bacterium]MBA3021574.1 16S rRNA (cytosine(1402)-N(4))-methyltransferase RsmH [Propionicimonas sp.]MBU3987124.1 16S rRNA (cytosine(1402)-N(4))-methyltransferase RsmH [Actinomycetota bacterium]MBU4008945.1 16S rRNA (cytosine(1402)-N(4))-methyltransferase RsmH [Actinomycetota bacterium]MBU4065905.1 16S rRNA (cytosine(1402)-N(4))-methyltra
MAATGDPAAATHVPVLLGRMLELLAPALQAPGSIYVDGTLGLGGHAEAMLTSCPQASLIGIDRDPQALELAGRRLAPFGDRVHLFHATYHELAEVLDEAEVTAVQAICLDLGLSSLQIDSTERGFAYSVDAPLDMRMNPEQELTAAEILNSASALELSRILRIHGDERFANRIAQAIVEARDVAPFDSSARLVSVIANAIPVAARHTGGHPAKRTFQALRIVVNAELESLAGVLPAALDALAPGGRLAVLAYHSGEDRLVKRAFAAATSDRVPAGVPAVPAGYAAKFSLLTRGAERPSPDETTLNPRAASARLRAVVRNQEVS